MISTNNAWDYFESLCTHSFPCIKFAVCFFAFSADHVDEYFLSRGKLSIYVSGKNEENDNRFWTENWDPFFLMSLSDEDTEKPW